MDKIKMNDEFSTITVNFFRDKDNSGFVATWNQGKTDKIKVNLSLLMGSDLWFMNEQNQVELITGFLFNIIGMNDNTLILERIDHKFNQDENDES